MDICFRCGLPKEACICSELEKERQKIKITVVERKFGKKVTIVEGISGDIKKIATKLKEELACGGTVKDNKIELQGDHAKKTKEKLIKLGFDEKNIE